MPKAADASKLILRSAVPLNAEGAPPTLAGTPITPVGAFFIRTHGTVPRLDAAMHRVEVGGLVRKPLSLSLDDLKRGYPAASVTATLLCAGNRRDELNAVDAVAGTGWGQGAIGNAEWIGVRLADILRESGAESGDLHVAFASADEIVMGDAKTFFGGSIPLAKALGPEVLVAYAMNGAPLAPEHGFPVRAVVPGYIGARSVKWLTGICVQERPSDNFYQQNDYKLLPAGDAASADWSGGVMLGELPVNSAILVPPEGATIASGPTRLRGYAIVGGGRTIGRVDVSADGGRNWRKAEIEARGAWAWALWETELTLAPGPAELVVRAWDSAAQTQPEHLETVWNTKGYMNNAWHRVWVTALGADDPAQAQPDFVMGEGI